jgi:antitoxin (DNA-binding transcriptional repressor) of toxin-antitoxin stability system
MKVTIQDLRYRAKEMLTAIERGETINLLQHGREIALVVPAHRSRVRGKELANGAFGMWKDRKDLNNAPNVVRTMRQSRFY